MANKRKQIWVSVTEVEHARVMDAVDKEGYASAAPWIRNIVLSAVKKVEAKPLAKGHK